MKAYGRVNFHPINVGIYVNPPEAEALRVSRTEAE